MKRIITTLLFAVASMLLSGCSHMLRTPLQDDHLEYNRAVNDSINQQLLVNIVRAHFNENALFVSIENITSRHSYQDELGGSFFLPFNRGGAASQLNTLTVSGKSTIKEEPSFIYTPQTNDKYAIELLQPLRMKALYYVIESESDISDILRLMLRRMGPYLNFEKRPIVRPYKKNIRSIQNFIALTHIFEKIYAENDYTVYLIPNKISSKEKLVFPIPEDIQLTANQWRLLRSIGIGRHDRKIVLCASPKASIAKGVVPVQIRSLVNVTDFLSFSVIPPQDKYKRQMLGADNTQTFFKFQNLLTRYIMHIRVSAKQPVDPFVAIKRRGYWYYIRDDDSSSKITFRLFRIFNDLTQAQTSANNILIAS